MTDYKVLENSINPMIESLQITKTLELTNMVVVLCNNNKVYMWGKDTTIKFGITGEKGASSVTLVPNGNCQFQSKNIIDIQGYFNTVYALDDQGKVYAWGNNNQGRLGVGDTVSRSTPTAVVDGDCDFSSKTITKIRFHDGAVFAIDNIGKVYSWGNNRSFTSCGRLGIGTTEDIHYPTQVLDGDCNFRSKNIIDVFFAGSKSEESDIFESVYALDDQGKVYSWGKNNYGQLGNNSTVDIYSPVAVANGSVNFTTKTIVNIYPSSVFCHALDSQGKVYAWGFNNTIGYLGDGSTSSKSSPVQLANGNCSFQSKNIVELFIEKNCSLALDDQGKVYGWGYNSRGQLGNGNTTNQVAPVSVIDGSVTFTSKTIIKLFKNRSSFLALDSQGKIYGWGENTTNGKYLGVGTNTIYNSPAQVLDGDCNFRSKNIVDMYFRDSYAIALDDQGKVYAWGDNSNGQLGYGDASIQNSPKAVVNGDISFTSKTIANIFPARYSGTTLVKDVLNDNIVWGKYTGNNSVNPEEDSLVPIYSILSVENYNAMPTSAPTYEISANGDSVMFNSELNNSLFSKLVKINDASDFQEMDSIISFGGLFEADATYNISLKSVNVLSATSSEINTFPVSTYLDTSVTPGVSDPLDPMSYYMYGVYFDYYGTYIENLYISHNGSLTISEGMGTLNYEVVDANTYKVIVNAEYLSFMMNDSSHLLGVYTDYDNGIRFSTQSQEAPIVSAPTVDITTGTYNEAQSITITPDINAISTYYTLDGTDPDNTKTLVDGPITVSGNDGDIITLKAVSYNFDGVAGAVLTETYTFEILNLVYGFNLMSNITDLDLGAVLDIHIEGNVLLAGSTTSAARKFSIVDITDPSAPIIRYTSAGLVSDVVVARKGNYLFLGNYNRIELFDISDSSNPVSLNSSLISTNNTVKGLSIENNTLAINKDGGTGGGQIFVYDITNPMSPVLKSTIPNSALFYPGSLLVRDNKLFFSNSSTNYLYIYDVSDLNNITKLSEIAHTHRITAIDSYGDLMAFGSWTKKTHIYDISNPVLPSQVAEIVDTHDIYGVVFHNAEVLFVASSRTGRPVTMHNITDLNNIQVIDSVSNTNSVYLLRKNENLLAYPDGSNIKIYEFQVEAAPLTLAPTVDVGTGTYGEAQIVTVTPDINAVSSYYTLDGTDPDNTKTLVDGSIMISGLDNEVITLKVVSYNTDGVAGAVLTEVYTFDIPAPIPEIPSVDIGSGIYNGAQTVTVTADINTVSSYYTLDGTEPDDTKTLVDGPIMVTGNHEDVIVLKVVNYNSDNIPGDILTQTYTFDISEPINFGQLIRLITNPNIPNEWGISLDRSIVSSPNTYSFIKVSDLVYFKNTLGVETTRTIIGLVFGSTEIILDEPLGENFEPNDFEVYVDTPTPIPSAPTIISVVNKKSQLFVVNPDSNATASYYTLDLSDPDNTSMLVDGPIEITGVDGDMVTLKVVGYNEDSVAGPISTNMFVFQVPPLPVPAAPTVDIGTGIYELAQIVTVSHDENSEYSYYTLDGVDPDETSTLVDGPITIGGEDGDIITLKVVSYNGDNVPGPILTETYRFIGRTIDRGTYSFG